MGNSKWSQFIARNDTKPKLCFKLHYQKARPFLKQDKELKFLIELTVTLKVSLEQAPPDVVDSSVEEGPSNVKDSKSNRK